MPRTVLTVLAGVALLFGLTSYEVTMPQPGAQPASPGPAPSAATSAPATTFLAVIRGARRSLAVENEEMDDSPYSP